MQKVSLLNLIYLFSLLSYTGCHGTITHLSCIMDGNRRWSAEHHLPLIYGYDAGYKAMTRVAKYCKRHKIPHVSIYALSLENFTRRKQDEIDAIYRKIINDKIKMCHKFLKHDMRVEFVGDRSILPSNILNALVYIEEQTKHCTTLYLHIMFCYGGRQDIAQAAQRAAQDVQNGLLLPEDLTQEKLAAYLWTAHIPDPDIIIRTGNAQRLSNYMLFQAAYTEFYFLDCLWPDITTDDLDKIVENFEKIQRNFGK